MRKKPPDSKLLIVKYLVALWQKSSKDVRVCVTGKFIIVSVSVEVINLFGSTAVQIQLHDFFISSSFFISGVPHHLFNSTSSLSCDLHALTFLRDFGFKVESSGNVLNFEQLFISVALTLCCNFSIRVSVIFWFY